MRCALAVLVSLALATTGYSRSWKKTGDIVGAGFYDHFRFDAIADPTHGRGNYVDFNTAKAKNLTYASDNTLILRADYTNIAGSRGRDTFRAVSTKSYQLHVSIFDVRHMPEGCGTWPAIWETGITDWPYKGETDILEGVNDAGTNSITLHTFPNCTMPRDRPHTGSVASTDCNALTKENLGCGVKDARPNSYGPAFNKNGGGWLAMERTETAITVWFWERNGNPPDEVRNGGDTIETDHWPKPAAIFPNWGCDVKAHYDDNNIIINLALCGDWAGGTYASNGCPGSCVDRVNNNPGAFANAYFDIAAIRVYE